MKNGCQCETPARCTYDRCQHCHRCQKPIKQKGAWR